MYRPDIFLSYNRQDAARAKLFADGFRAEGFDVWWDADLRSGEEYDRVTETALRDARAVVVLWSKRSVDSSWVRAEATQGQRNKTLMPAMIEDCVRPVMFELTQTAELSHWQGDRKDEAWRAFVSDLRAQVGEEGRQTDPRAVPSVSAPARPAEKGFRTKAMLIAAALLAVLIVAGAWQYLHTGPAAAHSMMVRLTGFEALSPDLPASTRATVDAELAAAFNADGVVGVSTASTPAPGSDPAYALGGTIQRDGGKIRVITNLTNERTGATVWGGTFNYEGNEIANVPRRIAVDAGNVVRCGLFGASTYHSTLPDAALRDYVQFCQAYWDADMGEGRKALVPAQRLVAAVPDFSWGWAAVAGAYWKVVMTSSDERLADEARASGREAADRAVAIDDRNSEALFIKAKLLQPHDWIGQEALFKRAVAARRLDCGCEHHQYGTMLANVGRLTDAVEQLRQANNTLALYVYTPLSLADALVIADQPREADPFYDAAIDLAQSSAFADRIRTNKASASGDVAALQDKSLAMPPDLRAALLAGYRARMSGDPAAKAAASRLLLGLDQRLQSSSVVWLLADLGPPKEAFDLAERLANREYPGPSIFWHPSMGGVLKDTRFPATAAKLGLTKYWAATNTRPDVCNAQSAAPFCRTI